MSASPLEPFFVAATHVTGRFAVLAGQGPVAGNLLHHAVEMYLKGGLAKTRTLQELKRLGHRLPAVWAEFKTHFNGAALGEFDTLIDSLDRFEELRYPDSVLVRGMQLTMGVTRADWPVVGHAVRPEPKYELYLVDVDALIRAVFSAVAVNPPFFMDRLSPRARQHLFERNDQQWAG